MLDPDFLGRLAERAVALANDGAVHPTMHEKVRKRFTDDSPHFPQLLNQAFSVLAAQPPLRMAEIRALREALHRALVMMTEDRWRRRRAAHNSTFTWERLPKKRAAELRRLIAEEWMPTRADENRRVSSLLQFDAERGEPRLVEHAFGSVRCAVAVLLAELLSPDARVEIKNCPKCNRFYVRHKAKGQPRIGCTNACSVALRKHR
jgi:hypothetical protein